MIPTPNHVLAAARSRAAAGPVGSGSGADGFTPVPAPACLPAGSGPNAVAGPLPE